MSFSSLPVELLQQIFSFLWYKDLRQISCVCHRWNKASEKLIVDRVKFIIAESFPRTYAELAEWDDRQNSLNIIRNSVRTYRTIVFKCNTALDEWQQLEPFVAECAERFSSIDCLYLDEIKCQYLHRLYTTHRDWITQCRSLHVSLSSCDYKDSKNDHAKTDWILNMPNLKHLSWEECNYDPLRSITIDAPNLKSIYVEGNESSRSGELRLQCSQLKHVEWVILEDYLPMMFETSLDNLESLQLTLDHRIDLEFIRALHQLKHLTIKFHCKMKSLDQLEASCAGLQIKTLKISCSVERCFINLEAFVDSFPVLEFLALSCVDFYAENCVQAKHLKHLELKNVEYFDGIVTLSVPNLKHITFDDNILANINLINTGNLSSFKLLLVSESTQNILEQIILPFLHTHEEVVCLSLIGKYYQKDWLNKPTNGSVELHIENLELKLINVTIGFFKMISEWKSLQTLSVNSCTIDCNGLGDSEMVHLPVNSLEILGNNRLKNTTRADFPLLAEGRTDV